MKLMRIIRGVLGTAVTWGIAWPLLSLPTFYRFLSDPPPGIGRFDMAVSILTHSTRDAFLMGGACGAVFALVLFAASRRVRSLQAISIPRAALIGAAAGLAIPLLATGAGSLMALVLAGALGGATSATALILARRAPSAALDRAPERARLPTT